MSSLEQEALSRKERLSQLRAKRAVASNKSEDGKSRVEPDLKKPKVVHRNYIEHNTVSHDSEEEEDQEVKPSGKIVLDGEDTVAGQSKELELELLAKYNQLTKVDWVKLLAGDDVEEKVRVKETKVGDEYREKLKLQELELLKMTNDKILELRKVLNSEK